MKTTDKTTASVATSICTRATQVGDDLSRSFTTLLGDLPGQPSAAKDMAQALNVDKVLIHKIISALRSKDPLGTAHAIPGPVPLMRVIKAAKRVGVATGKVRAAEEAVSSFKHLIDNEAGDRGSLDAVISTLLPDARKKFETPAKQSIYRGIRQLKGFSANVTFLTFMLTPSEKGDRCDLAAARGFLGLRCVRPGATMKVAIISSVANIDAGLCTLDGHPVTDARQMMLPDFCSNLPEEFAVYESEENIIFAMEWGDLVGPLSVCDFVMGEMRRNAVRRWKAPQDATSRTGVNDGISVPTRVCVYDIILHKDIYPDWEPRVNIFEIGELGLADPNDQSRKIDALNLDVDVKPMGTGIRHFRANEIPNYTDLLAKMCNKVGVAPDQLRGYRTRIEFPVFGTHIQFAFDLPPAPGSQTP